MNVRGTRTLASVLAGLFLAIPAATVAAKKPKPKPKLAVCKDAQAVNDLGQKWSRIAWPKLPDYLAPDDPTTVETEGVQPNGVKSWAIDPVDPNVVYVVDDSGVLLLKSTDGGCSWKEIRKLGDPASADRPEGTMDDVIAPAHGVVWTTRTLAAKTPPDPPDPDHYREPKRPVDKSSDGGQTWELEYLTKAGDIEGWHFAPSNPDVVYDTSVRDTSFIENPGWPGEPVPAYPNDTPTRSEVVSSSTDGGKTWTQVYGSDADMQEDPPSGYGSFDDLHFVIDPLDPKRLWMATGVRLRHSTDGGDTWKDALPLEKWQHYNEARRWPRTSTGNTGLAINHVPGQPARLIALNWEMSGPNQDDGIKAWRSDDGGQSWYQEPVPDGTTLVSWAHSSKAGPLVHFSSTANNDATYLTARYDARLAGGGRSPWIALPPEPEIRNDQGIELKADHRFLTQAPPVYFVWLDRPNPDDEVLLRYSGRL